MPGKITHRPFTPSDTGTCLALFDKNCPDYFVPNERDEFASYLKKQAADYTVYERDGCIIGAFGFDVSPEEKQARIHWIMIDPSHQKLGLGGAMMHEAIERGAIASLRTIHISASQHSAPFFAHFGAQETAHHPDGWGLGMHRVDMVLVLSSRGNA